MLTHILTEVVQTKIFLTGFTPLPLVKAELIFSFCLEISTNFALVEIFPQISIYNFACHHFFDL